MVARRKSTDQPANRRPPATTPEGRENQMIMLAVDLAEKQIREGTASSQVISHYLKLGTTRERLEQQKLEHENALTMARIESLASASTQEELYKEALKAMSKYTGNGVMEDDEDD